MLTRAPLGYSAERAPLPGGGQILPPCLTPKQMVVERWKKRQTKALNKANVRITKNFAEVKGQVRVRLKVNTAGFHIN